MNSSLMNSLFGRLLQAHVLVLAITLMVIGGSLSYLYTESVFRSREQELVDNGRRIAQAVGPSFQRNQLPLLLRTRVEAIAGTLQASITLADREGLIALTTLDDSRALRFRLSAYDVRNVLEQGSIITRRGYEEALQDRFVTAIVPVGPPNAVGGAVILHAPIGGTTETIRQGAQLLLLAGFLAAVAGVLVSYFLSRRIVAPIQEMTAASKEMAKGNFDQKVPVNAQGEIGALARAFNELSSRLGKTIDELIQEKQKSDSILAGMSDGVVAIDPDGEVILANPATETLFDRPRSWLGLCMEDDEFLKEFWEHFLPALEGKTRPPVEIHLGDRVFLLNVAPLKDSEGNVRGAVGIFHDVSERFRLEKMRRDFLANVSHELRTPLTSIRGFAQAILEGMVTDEKQSRRYLQVIMDESVRLSRLVHTVLDLSRIESKAISLTFEPLDLEQMIEEITEGLEPFCIDRGVHIEVDLPRGLPPIRGDQDWTPQILRNLLENGVRHAPPATTVYFRARHEEGMIVAEIEDEGPGIPEEDLPYIWERFYKADRSRRFERGVGTGLGLVIVKELVAMHDGRVVACNRKPHGALFRVELPLYEEDEDQDEEARADTVVSTGNGTDTLPTKPHPNQLQNQPKSQ